FDAHAYRTEDYEGVKDFARGCMRTYLILKDKAQRWNKEPEIQRVLREANPSRKNSPSTQKYSKSAAGKLLETLFDREAILQKRLLYERLDQLTVEVLLGIR